MISQEKVRVVQYSDKFMYGIRQIYAWYFIVSILYKSMKIKNEAKQWEI